MPILTRRMIAIIALMAISAATACDAATDSNERDATLTQKVTAVVLEPVPEGQVLEYSDDPDAAASLDAVREAIPSPLPDPVEQECERGGSVVAHLEDGSTISYGPCELPGSIEELKQAIITAEAERRADCDSPDEGPVPRREGLIERARIYAAALREVAPRETIYLRDKIFKGDFGGKGTLRPMTPALQTLIYEELGHRKVELCHGDISPWAHSVITVGEIDRDEDKALVPVDVGKSGGCTYELSRNKGRWKVESQSDCYNY